MDAGDVIIGVILVLLICFLLIGFISVARVTGEQALCWRVLNNDANISPFIEDGRCVVEVNGYLVDAMEFDK